MNKYSASIKYGVIAGIVMIIVLMLIYFVHRVSLGSTLPRVVYVFLIFGMIWGGITIRREQGNFSGFGNAFLTVFIISFTATMLFDSFHYVLYRYIDPEIPAMVTAQKIEAVKDLSDKLGLSDEQTEKEVRAVKEFDSSPNLKNELLIYTQSAVIGAIFSLVIGLFVNRPDGGRVIKAEE